MMKSLLAGAAAFAMMTGVALAQGMSSDTSSSTTTSTVMPPVGSFSATKSKKTMDSNGNESEHTRSYSRGSDGVDASSSSRTVTPDGSEMSTHREKSVSPEAGMTTQHETSTTIEH
jgi:histone deacetylase complex regulatory component SIN3